MYTKDGIFPWDLPELLHPRMNHGCAKYINKDNERVHFEYICNFLKVSIECNSRL